MSIADAVLKQATNLIPSENHLLFRREEIITMKNNNMWFSMINTIDQLLKTEFDIH